MTSTTKKIDVRFQIVLEGQFATAYSGAAATLAAAMACKMQSQGCKPHLYAVWVDAECTPKSKRVAITTTRDTTARLSSLKKMIQNGEPIDG